jgi:hypothetical protein
LVGSLIGGISVILNKSPSKSYENKVLYQALIGLGLDAKTADELLKIPSPALPVLPTTGLLGKVAALDN